MLVGMAAQVLPVKTSYRNRAAGVVHLHSASGNTALDIELFEQSISMKKLPTIELMNAMKSFRFWRII